MIVLTFSYVDRTQNLRTWDDKMEFKDMKEAKAYLKENFPHKRQPMYIDLKDGSTKKCGYVYNRRNKYDTGKTFLEEIWVSFYEEDIKPVYFN